MKLPLPSSPTSAPLHRAYGSGVHQRGHLSQPLGCAPAPNRSRAPGLHGTTPCWRHPSSPRALPVPLLATMPWPVGHCHARAPPLTGSPPTHLLCSEASPSPFSTPCTREPSPGLPCIQNKPPTTIAAAQADLAVETPPKAFLCTSRPLEWKLLGLLKLSDPSSPSFPHRSMDAGKQSHRRPPLTADSPTPTLSRRAKTTGRLHLSPSSFSPTFPLPLVTLLIGKRRTIISPIL